MTTSRNYLTWARRAVTTGMTFALLGAAGCNSALTVETPDILPPESLTGAAAIPTIHAGVIGDFSFAVVGNAGGTEGIISVSGSISDELGNSETFPTRKEYDIREMNEVNTTLTGLFRNLHRARRAAEKGAENIKAAAPSVAAEARIAEDYNLAGMIYIYLAETFCGGMPVGDADASGVLIYGKPVSTAELFQKAVANFDSGAKYAINTTQTNFAKVGKARALMNLGKDQFDAAAALVSGVPTTFTYKTTHTNLQDRQWNGVSAFINQFKRFSLVNNSVRNAGVPPLPAGWGLGDGGNGILFATDDPRIPWVRLTGNNGFDGSTPQLNQGIYPSETTSLTIAGGVEARLIEAEAALKNGSANWLTILNTLRANTTLYPPVSPTDPYPVFPNLGQLTDPGTQVAREDMLFRERGFWLFLTGHRQGDLRRLIRQYGRTEAQVFPGGGGQPYIINGNNKGGNFGTDVAIPIPFDETNNPDYVRNFPACKKTA